MTEGSDLILWVGGSQKRTLRANVAEELSAGVDHVNKLMGDPRGAISCPVCPDVPRPGAMVQF